MGRRLARRGALRWCTGGGAAAVAWQISEAEEDVEEEDEQEDMEHIRMGDKLVSIR